MYALRKQLGDGVVETQAPGYRLRVDPGSLDLLEFERLVEEARTAPVADSIELRRRALALWRGPPLADVALEGPERHSLGRLSEQRLTTQIERIDAEVQLGRHAHVLGELEALVAEHPYQERAAALLMLALYRSGRQADALEVYRTVGGRLSDELGLQPGKELRDLEAAILRQDDALAAPIAVREPSVAEGRDDRAGAADRADSATSATARARRRARPARRRRGPIAALLLRDEPAPVVVPPNSVAVIDVDTNRVELQRSGRGQAGPGRRGAGFVWVGNLDDRSLTRIDPATNEPEPIRLEATPDAVTADGAAVWVVNGRLGTLYRVDPESGSWPSRSARAEIVQVRGRRGGRRRRVGVGGVRCRPSRGWIRRRSPATLALRPPSAPRRSSSRTAPSGSQPGPPRSSSSAPRRTTSARGPPRRWGATRAGSPQATERSGWRAGTTTSWSGSRPI